MWRPLERDASRRVVGLAQHFHDPCHSLVLCTFKFTVGDNEDDDMSRGYPSMTALLGLLAIAGYQNRDKIAEMLRGGAQPNPAAPGQVPQAARERRRPETWAGYLAARAWRGGERRPA